MKDRYESYKDSGVPWIGQVPQGWEVRRLPYIFRTIGSGTTPDTSNATYYENGSYNWLQTGDLNDGEIVVTQKKINEKALKEYSTLKVYPKGSLVVAMYGATIGKVGLTRIETATNQACCVLAPSEKVVSEYAFYALIASKQSLINKAAGGGQPNISQGIIRQHKIPYPPLPEQRAIAGYLDARCAAIDAYVASLEREAALARELKQALIARAVTRGLDPNAPMRDSGIPWIGQVPQGWEVETFGKHFTFGKGLPITKADLVPEGIAVLSYGQIHAKYNKGTTISDNMVRYVPSNFISTNPKSLLNKGDFVFADTSEDIEGSGNFGFNDYADVIFAGYHTIIARPINLAYPKYYAYLFQSMGWKSQVQSKVNGVKVYSITKEILKGTSILLPPLPEQRAIAGYLDARCAAIDAYVASLEREAVLARELKQREIADAVTGKVKITA